jgi:two-component system, NtrC family, sensor kinase
MQAVDQKPTRGSQTGVALERLLQVGQSLTGIEGDAKTILEQIAASACVVLGADIVTLYEYDEKYNDVKVPPVIWGKLRDPDHLETKDPAHPTSVVFKVLEQAEPLYARNAGRDWKQPTPKSTDGLQTKGFVAREGIASSAAVRLTAGGKRVGVLFVNYRTPHTFRINERRNIELFATQAAVAIRNSRLVAEHIRQHKGHETLNRVGTKLAALQDEIAILDQVARATFETIDCQHCTILAVRGETLEVVASAGNRAWSLPRGLVRSRRGVAGWVAEHGGSALVPDTGRDDRFDPNWSPGQPDPKSLIDVSIDLGSRRYGVISVEHDRERAFDDHDLQLVQTLANQAAIAIQNARLLQDERQRGDDLNLLREISEKVSSTLDLDETLAAIVAAAMRLTKTDTGVIYLVNETGQSITRSLEYPVGFHPTPRFSTANSLTRTIVDTGLPINVPDIAKDLRVNQEVLKKGVKSLIGLPLKFGGKIIGALFLNARQPRQFTQEHLTLLLPLAERAATAIQNATLYGAVQVVQRISKSMSETLDLDQILSQIVNGAAGLVHADSGVIHLIDEAKETIGQSYEFPQGSGHLSPRFDERRGLTWKIYQAGQPVDVPDISQAEPEVRERDWGDRRALIGLPLKLAGRVSGVLFLYSLRPRVFTSSEKELLTTLTEQAALAIDNAQRYEQRAKDLSALEEINEAITTRSWPEIAELIAREAAEISKADYGGLWLVEEGSLVLGAMHPKEAEDVPPPPQRLAIDEYSINGWVAKTGHPHNSGRVGSDLRYLPWNPAVKSSAAVPMRFQEKVVGTLSIESARAEAFSDQQISLLQSLANQAAIATENAKTYERTIELLTVLTDIGQAMKNEGNDKILDLVYDYATKIMDLTDAQVQFAFYDQRKDEVSFPLAIEQDNGIIIDRVRWSTREALYRYPGEDETVVQFKARSRAARFGLTEYVIHARTPILISRDFEMSANALTVDGSQVRVWPRFGRHDRPTHSWLGVPMAVGGRVIGVISIQSLEIESAFNQKHVALLSAVANQAAIAMLYLETQRLYQEARGEVIAAKQLATLGTAMAALRHRINNTFNVIVPNVTRLKKRVDASDATIAEILDIIERNARYTSDIIARIQEPLREMEVQDVNVNAVLDEAIAWVKEKWSAERVAMPISLASQLADPLPQVQAPIGQLTEVFRNLLDNAYRAMQEKGGKLTVLSCLTDGIICVRVLDAGPGIPLLVAQRLFEKPVPSKEPGGGAGLGLWLSRLMLQSIGGNVIIESTRTSEPTGTTMLVQIPASPARQEVQ